MPLSICATRNIADLRAFAIRALSPLASASASASADRTALRMKASRRASVTRFRSDDRKRKRGRSSIVPSRRSDAIAEDGFAMAPSGRFPRYQLFCVHRQSRRWSTLRGREGRRQQRARPAIGVLHQFVAGKSNMTRRAIGRQACACCPARHRHDFVVEVVKIFNWSERRDLNSGPPVPQT
jgi:hypothetical protein